ncbi:MAG TPA: dTDP-4-dehydrorhamnose reductase [Terracidiphilus sp.]|nr:dTDP-4-dehydrorhamnose reductase [Terracidiphilus sp.]
MTPREPRILLLGSAGQVGRELQARFADFGDLTSADRKSADLAHPEQLRELVRHVAPDLILNAAAYTAVDRAESEPALAMTVNAEAPGVLAEEALRLGALLVHYSTDYVFDGSKEGPWIETDETNPLSVYGATKLAGERAIESSGCSRLIFRTSWVYGPHGKNFLFTMLRLARERERLTIVNDQFGAPTTSIKIASATRKIIEGVMAGRFGAEKNWAGIYHMTCADSTSWFGFAQAIFARAGSLLGGKVPELVPIATAEYPTPARRPHNSVLSNAKLVERFGVSLAPWPIALDAVMAVLEPSATGSKRVGV